MKITKAQGRAFLLALLPTLALADGTYQLQNFTFSDGVTTQFCQSGTLVTQGCSPVTSAPRQFGLSNVSIRGRVGLGDDVVILGFVVPEGPSRAFYLKGRGPSLTAFGVAGALQDPILTLVSQTSIFATNDNWNEPTQVEAILGTGDPPTDTREAAMIVVLSPGAYTAILSGAFGQTGVGIVEIFPR